MSAPAIDPTSSSFWTSPSSYVTLATFVLPLITTLFHKDTTAVAQAISQAAPLLAAVALLVMRGLHKQTVLQTNAQLQAQGAQIHADELSHKRQMAHEAHLHLLDKLTPAAAQKLVNATTVSQLSA